MSEQEPTRTGYARISAITGKSHGALLVDFTSATKMSAFHNPARREEPESIGLTLWSSDASGDHTALRLLVSREQWEQIVAEVESVLPDKVTAP